MCYCIMDSDPSCTEAKCIYTQRTCGDAATHWKEGLHNIQKVQTPATCRHDYKAQIESFVETSCNTARKRVCDPTSEHWQVGRNARIHQSHHLNKNKK
mmetsp:Transcript_70270/g.159532  ORF Transcript_70270/g.159532 Transcript_70270/m.159532 type:complete len:98 (+) Transcript_70270:1697-1990(+)